MANWIKKGKMFTSVSGVVIGGFKKAYQIDAFKKPPRDILPKYIQTFCRKACQSFGIEVVQLEPVPQTHGLWASNHISWVDIPVVGSVSSVFFLSKAEIANWPVFGKLAKAAGTLFIERGSGDVGSVGNQIANFMQAGSSVVFFPEATTTNGHKVKRVYGKLLQAVIQTGLPIQPMVICYVGADGNISDDVAYYGNITMQESLDKVLNADKITAYVLPLEAIYPENKTQKELAEILQERMQAGLVRLQKQVLKTQPVDAVWDDYDV
ncbi:MAG: 1-acyl-sn-glycerol-3-phosphate acyltransferase [Gammaproteobacteria bacterium]|nr:MAG: 1-acyl-sn-glycerol-3-phosphate acyltransferase [Gammaproteobacteria bacterium]